jgi:hypothetical protein
VIGSDPEYRTNARRETKESERDHAAEIQQGNSARIRGNRDVACIFFLAQKGERRDNIDGCATGTKVNVEILVDLPASEVNFFTAALWHSK